MWLQLYNSPYKILPVNNENETIILKGTRNKIEGQEDSPMCTPSSHYVALYTAKINEKKQINKSQTITGRKQVPHKLQKNL